MYIFIIIAEYYYNELECVLYKTHPKKERKDLGSRRARADLRGNVMMMMMIKRGDEAPSKKNICLYYCISLSRSSFFLTPTRLLHKLKHVVVTLLQNVTNFRAKIPIILQLRYFRSCALRFIFLRLHWRLKIFDIFAYVQWKNTFFRQLFRLSLFGSRKNNGDHEHIQQDKRLLCKDCCSSFFVTKSLKSCKRAKASRFLSLSLSCVYISNNNWTCDIFISVFFFQDSV